jgi:hypothetical protein
MIVTQINGFYTVKIGQFERCFLTAWQLIAFLSGTDETTQKN